MVECSQVQVLDAGGSCPELPIVDGPGVARAVVWPGVGARLRSMHRMSLAAGARTKALRHTVESVYYVMNGTGIALDTVLGDEQPLIEGSMAHIDPDTSYVFIAGPEGIEILGGPCPADPGMYEHLGAT